MNNQKILKVLNAIIAILFISVITSALLADTMSGETYAIVHKLPGFLLAIGVAIHIILNRAWVKNSYCKNRK